MELIEALQTLSVVEFDEWCSDNEDELTVDQIEALFIEGGYISQEKIVPLFESTIQPNEDLEKLLKALSKVLVISVEMRVDGNKAFKSILGILNQIKISLGDEKAIKTKEQLNAIVHADITSKEFKEKVGREQKKLRKDAVVLNEFPTVELVNSIMSMTRLSQSSSEKKSTTSVIEIGAGAGLLANALLRKSKKDSVNINVLALDSGNENRATLPVVKKQSLEDFVELIKREESTLDMIGMHPVILLSWPRLAMAEGLMTLLQLIKTREPSLIVVGAMSVCLPFEIYTQILRKFQMNFHELPHRSISSADCFGQEDQPNTVRNSIIMFACTPNHPAYHYNTEKIISHLPQGYILPFPTEMQKLARNITNGIQNQAIPHLDVDAWLKYYMGRAFLDDDLFTRVGGILRVFAAYPSFNCYASPFKQRCFITPRDALAIIKEDDFDYPWEASQLLSFILPKQQEKSTLALLNEFITQKVELMRATGDSVEIQQQNGYIYIVDEKHNKGLLSQLKDRLAILGLKTSDIRKQTNTSNNYFGILKKVTELEDSIKLKKSLIEMLFDHKCLFPFIYSIKNLMKRLGLKESTREKIYVDVTSTCEQLIIMFENDTTFPSNLVDQLSAFFNMQAVSIRETPSSKDKYGELVVISREEYCQMLEEIRDNTTLKLPKATRIGESSTFASQRKSDKIQFPDLPQIGLQQVIRSSSGHSNV